MVRLVLTVLVVLLGVLSTLVLALLFISPGQPSPVTELTSPEVVYKGPAA